MQAIAILEHEHEAILFGIAMLERVSERAAAGDEAARKDAPELVRFLNGFADACHHGKEEGILFPAMERAGILGEGGPIGVMLEEHAQGRAYVRGMADALAVNDFGPAFGAQVSGYASLLRSHIAKENGILFPMGAKALGPDRLESMGAEFDAFEATVMGRGEHEKLHALLEAFAERYSA